MACSWRDVQLFMFQSSGVNVRTLTDTAVWERDGMVCCRLWCHANLKAQRLSGLVELVLEPEFPEVTGYGQVILTVLSGTSCQSASCILISLYNDLQLFFSIQPLIYPSGDGISNSDVYRLLNLYDFCRWRTVCIACELDIPPLEHYLYLSRLTYMYTTILLPQPSGCCHVTVIMVDGRDLERLTLWKAEVSEQGPIFNMITSINGSTLSYRAGTSKRDQIRRTTRKWETCAKIAHFFTTPYIH